MLDGEVRHVLATLRRGAIPVVESRRPWPMQTAFFASREVALRRLSRWRALGVTVTFPFYHGYPGEGEPAFDELFTRLRAGHSHVARIQVTHTKMRDLLLDAGVAEDRVRLIRIGVDTAMFVLPTLAQRAESRVRLGLPEHAVVVGSFQKDGNGWGDGLEPKRVKGPDVLVAALTRLKGIVPELWVLLSGPARGFVKRELTRRGIPFVHVEAAADDMPKLYHALDAYLVASRQEGGPKAILESMSSGVPIVSTRVGQAPDLITHGETGYLADIGDEAALAAGLLATLADETWRASYRRAARAVAEANDYVAQQSAWMQFFEGLVTPPR